MHLEKKKKQCIQVKPTRMAQPLKALRGNLFLLAWISGPKTALGAEQQGRLRAELPVYISELFFFFFSSFSSFFFIFSFFFYSPSCSQ